jgi:putative ATP-dependent endonuclease of OLD family
MYLKSLLLSNFRKYENLSVEFKKGLNVLIGENDSGKTAIIDAIRYLLNTKSFETVSFDSKDFYQKKSSSARAESFEIIGIFDGFIDSEAANFLEWGYFNQDKNFELRLLLKVNLQNNNRITWDLKAGSENAETQMDGNARELLKVTYLKPLRDAETELTPGYRSRLAQILRSHKNFQKTKDENGLTKQHPLEGIIKKANDEIDEHLRNVKARGRSQ